MFLPSQRFTWFCDKRGQVAQALLDCIVHWCPERRRDHQMKGTVLAWWAAGGGKEGAGQAGNMLLGSQAWASGS